MNRSTASAIAVALAAAASYAYPDDISIDPTPFASTRTRVEVLSELKKPGPNPWSSQYNMFQIKSSRPSQEVRQEYVLSRDEVSALNGEDSGSAYLNGVGFKGRPGTGTMGAPAR